MTANRIIPTLFACLMIAFSVPGRSAATSSNAGLDPVRGFAEKGAIKVEYFVYGSGAETLLMIAGNGRSAEDLMGIARRVGQAGYRVVVLNHRGIGASEGPMQAATLHDLAADVWQVADALQLQKVHLAGKTYGQRVMRTASADKPERVLSLVLMAAGGEIMPAQEVQNAYRRMREPGILPDEWLKLYAFANFAPANADKAKLGIGGSFPKVANAQIAISERTPLEEWRQGGSAPMLVIQGLEDKVAVPQNAFNLATSRANTWLVGIPNCGHNMVYEQADEIAAHIVAFLRTHGKSESLPAAVSGNTP